MFVCGGGSTYANGAYTYHGTHNGAMDMRNEHGYELWKYVAPGNVRSFWAVTRSSSDLEALVAQPTTWLYESTPVPTDSAEGALEATDFAAQPLPAAWSVQSGGMRPAPIISSVPCPTVWVCGAAAAEANGEYTMSGGARNGAAQFHNAQGSRLQKVTTGGANAHWWAISALDGTGALAQLYGSKLDSSTSTLPPTSVTLRWSVLANGDEQGPTVRGNGEGCVDEDQDQHS